MFNYSIFITLLFLMCFSSGASAELAYIDPVTSQSVLEQVVQKFHGKVQTWQGVIQAAAERLFWSLVLISMVWTFGMMILRKADIGDFFAEFTRRWRRVGQEMNFANEFVVGLGISILF